MACIRPSARGLDEAVLAAAQAAKSAAFDRGYPPREQARRDSPGVMLGKMKVLGGSMYVQFMSLINK